MTQKSIYQTMRMIQAVTLVGGFGPMLTYCFEICGDKHRSMIYVLMAGIPWSLGFGFIAYIADLTRHWWTLLAIFIGITVPFPLLYIFTMPESYKFFIAKKRWTDAKKSMKRFPKNKPADVEDEKLNEKMIQEVLDDNFLEECDEKLKFNWALKLRNISKNEAMFTIQIIKGHLSCQKIVQARFILGKKYARVFSNEFEHNIF